MIPRHHDFRRLTPILLSLILTLWSVPPLLAFLITDQLSLSGLVNNVSTFRLSDLQAYTSVTHTVAVQSRSSTLSSSFTEGSAL